jgi:release factor glutamine methyltransferase
VSASETADILLDATTRLRAAGVESPRREARLLLAHVLGLRPEEIVSGRFSPQGAEFRGRFEAVLARRAAREPLAYIIGRREFWSLDFEVGPGVLVPRPESEIMVEEALRRFPIVDAPLRVVDLGTGSGCLLLAFLSERPKARVWCRYFRGGAHRRQAQRGTFGPDSRAHSAERLDGRSFRDVDVIFINPPYIVEGDRRLGP